LPFPAELAVDGRRFSAIRLRRLFRARALLFNAGFECP
jgi:hypothetical protein